MDEMTENQRTLSLFAALTFKDSYWSLSPGQRSELGREWLDGLNSSARKVDLYQVFPAHDGLDLLVWCSLPANDPGVAADFFEKFASATNPHRAYLDVRQTLWGFTHPSQYSRASRSAQEIDPFASSRLRYLIVYPFVKTSDWYALGPEARQGMMNEHIRIGKQYTAIKQLLLYSFGLQDQEFIVVYETDDLALFSDLVAELRAADNRRYTLRDTPIVTAVHHPAKETLALWQ